MLKSKSTDRNLLAWIGLNVFTVAILLALVRLLGEVHGLMATLIVVIGQSTLSYVRLGALERELRALRAAGDVS